MLQEVTLEALRRVENSKRLIANPFGWLVSDRGVPADRHSPALWSPEAGRSSGSRVRRPRWGLAPNSDGEPVDRQLDLAESAFTRDQKEFRLQAMLAELPEESRQALHLRYVDGLATKEIAERLGKTDGAIRVLLTRRCRSCKACSPRTRRSDGRVGNHACPRLSQ